MKLHLDLALATTAVVASNSINEPAIVREIPIGLLLWTFVGACLGAGSGTLFANEHLNNTLFYRRLFASIMGGVGVTPLILLALYSFFAIKLKHLALASLVYDPASIVGMTFCVSLLFWTFMTWHQLRSQALLDRLAGIEEEPEPRRTVVIVQTDNAAEILKEVKDERL